MFVTSLINTNIQITKKLSLKVLIQQQTSQKMTIKLEALANGLASKDAQRMKILLILTQRNLRIKVLLIILLFSKSTSTVRIRLQQVLILLITQMLISLSFLPRKKFCFSLCSLSKLQKSVNLKHNILRSKMIKVTSKRSKPRKQ
jgi:hypothetical protein